MQFTRISQLSSTVSEPFAARTLEAFVFLQKRPLFVDKPFKRRRASQCGPWAAGRRGSNQIPATDGAGVRGKGGGKPRGSPRARFGGSEGALEGPAGEVGGARRWPPRGREIPARWGRIRATHGGGGLHGVPGRGRVAGRRWKEGEGTVHRVAPMAAGGGARSSGGRVWRGWLAGGSP
jgi:hypothetical protein